MEGLEGVKREQAIVSIFNNIEDVVEYRVEDGFILFFTCPHYTPGHYTAGHMNNFSDIMGSSQ